MRLTYRLLQEGNGWLAECVESDAAATGATPAEAVTALHAALEERMFRPEAVAPPPETEHSVIELELSNDRSARPSLDLGGPGS